MPCKTQVEAAVTFLWLSVAAALKRTICENKFPKQQMRVGLQFALLLASKSQILHFHA